jgi:3-polyprenyl-4-hydroxybenzoate decarboxylase
MEKNIYDIFMINETISESIKKDFNFNFECLDVTKIEKKTYLFEQFLISFEKIEKIDNKTYLLKITMGAFERPEAIYLIAGEKSYYFNEPIHHQLNQEAHNKLKEILRCQKL